MQCVGRLGKSSKHVVCQPLKFVLQFFGCRFSGRRGQGDRRVGIRPGRQRDRRCWIRVQRRLVRCFVHGRQNDHGKDDDCCSAHACGCKKRVATHSRAGTPRRSITFLLD